MAVYQGKTVELNSPRRIRKGEPGYGRKKSLVYVKDGSKVKKVMFGDPNMKIKRFSDKNRRDFRARHRCDTNKPTDKTKARYWSCKFWESRKSVTDLLS